MVFLACLVFLAGLAQGQTVFNVNLDGAQVPTASTFTGSGTVTLNPAQTQITVAVTHNFPNSQVSDAHIHHAPAGSNGPVVLPFPGMGQNPINEVINVTPADVTQLLAGNYYINIHTVTFPNGEIRGQILLAPSVPAASRPYYVALTASLVVLAAIVLYRMRRSATT
jgi:hypothetical protein